MSRQYDQKFVDVPEFVTNGEDGWRDGVGYSSLGNAYCITSDGEVISLLKNEPRIMKTYANQHGHRYVDIRADGGKSKYSVHRLVAQAFVPNGDGCPIARHLNDIPDDNDYENLAWGTAKDNRNDCVRNGHDYHKGVYCHENGKTYRSGADAARDLDISRAAVSKCCNGISEFANGYHLCYASETEEKLSDPVWGYSVRKTGYKPVVAIDHNGNRHRFNSRKEASEALNIPSCGISSVLSGHIGHTHGWRFEEGGEDRG